MLLQKRQIYLEEMNENEHLQKQMEICGQGLEMRLRDQGYFLSVHSELKFEKLRSQFIYYEIIGTLPMLKMLTILLLVWNARVL